MTKSSNSIRLTMAQALVRHLAVQFVEIDGKRQRLCAGGFGIFGHGNVTCLGEALYSHREELPLYRGQNEQSMAMAAIGYAKEKLRRRFMFATSSATRNNQYVDRRWNCPYQPTPVANVVW